MAFLGGVIGNEQHIPSQAIQWLCLFRNMLLVSAFRHLGNKDIAKRSAEDGVPWRVIGNEQHIPI